MDTLRIKNFIFRLAAIEEIANLLSEQLKRDIEELRSAGEEDMVMLKNTFRTLVQELEKNVFPKLAIQQKELAEKMKTELQELRQDTEKLQSKIENMNTDEREIQAMLDQAEKDIAKAKENLKKF